MQERADYYSSSKIYNVENRTERISITGLQDLNHCLTLTQTHACMNKVDHGGFSNRNLHDGSPLIFIMFVLLQIVAYCLIRSNWRQFL